MQQHTNAFGDIFDSTTDFLRVNGISPKVFKSNKATYSDVKKFHQQTGVRLPENFSVFFTEFADGFEFAWEKSEDEWGVFSMPSLKQLSKERQEWERNVRDFLDDPNSLDKCIDPPFRAEAFEIWRRMNSWIPFWNDGSGDHFCVDSTNGLIIYDQHDWFDGFGSLAKMNGIVAGKNLRDFLQNWSRFCFTTGDNYWPSQFSEFGSIKWNPEYFNPKYFRGC